MKTVINQFIATLMLSTLASAAQMQETNESIFSRSQKFDREGIELYDSNIDLKSYKKIGLGLSTGGLTGTLGLNLEINVAKLDAVGFGIGTSKAFNSFNINWKRNYESAYLSPYVKGAYANWFNSSSNSGSEQFDILGAVLSESEKQENRFSKHFFAAGAGLEYNQLEGELSGLNFYGELLIMAEVKSAKYLPTAGIGLTYFY